MNKDMENYELVGSIDGSDFGVKLFVKRPPETIERIANLSDTREDLSLSDKELAGCLFGKTCRVAYDMLHKQAAELDPATWERAKKTKAEFVKAFDDAGFDAIFMEEIPNEYFGADDPWGMSDPWYIVTTKVGHIKVGWRKRVILLDWDRTTLEDTTALFSDDDVTKGDTMIHAWNYEKLTSYLESLNEFSAHIIPVESTK